MSKKFIVLLLLFFAISFVVLILNLYTELNEKSAIDVHNVNSQLLKSMVISLAVLVVIVGGNRKKLF